MTEKNADMALIQRHATELGEHFDTVQIFVTRHESGQEGGTVNLILGDGNWFARYGFIKEWLVKQDEQIRINVRNNQGESPEKGEL